LISLKAWMLLVKGIGRQGIGESRKRSHVVQGTGLWRDVIVLAITVFQGFAPFGFTIIIIHNIFII
jgi:hypothetical protein